MRTRELTAPPRLAPLLVKAVLTAPARRGGELPDAELVLPGVVADPDHLARYARVCGFPLGSDLPPTYPHILGFPLAMRLMTDPGFPFPLPGLVHAGNLIEQHRPVPAGVPLTVRVRVGGLERTERGTRFVVFTEAYAGEDLAWREESRYLRLSGDRGSRKPDARDSRQEVTPGAIWRVPAGAGRRYAAVSGDHNPIHLHPLGARLAGFRRPIAHGMWILARCLAALQGRIPDTFRAEVAFRRAVPLPSTVGFAARRDGARWRIGVYDTTGRGAYLTGTVDPA